MKAYGPFLDGYGNVHNQLWEHIRGKTIGAIEAHARVKAALAAPAEVYGRAEVIRDTFVRSLGGLPEAAHPLNARTVGTIDREGYVIEKVIFESQPQVYVTASLYVPKGITSPAPGVLFLSGHHRDARMNPEYQDVCHDLVVNGFVVLATDPTGQGERISHYDPVSGESALDWGTTEHSYQGQQCVLTGTSLARYFLFDAFRGLDYLESREEVDGGRIGATGNSGGGTQTTLLCMLGEPRVKVAAPCTYVTARKQYFLGGSAQDAEQIQFGMVKNGIDFDDMFIPFAPRPLMIGAVESDFFDPAGTRQTYEKLRQIYALLGVEENVSLVVSPGRHKYTEMLRHAMVRWFAKHLCGPAENALILDEPPAAVPEDALWCTSKGQVRTDFADARTPYHLNLERLGPRSIEPDSLGEQVEEVLGIRERLDAAGRLFPRQLDEQEQEGVHGDSILFMSEPGVETTGCLLYQGTLSKDAVTIYLAPGGTSEMDARIEEVRPALERGEAVYVFDVRGTGAVKPHPINSCGDTFPATFYNTENWLAWCAYCVGENLLGMRVFDVLRAAQMLREWAGFARVGLWAAGLEPSLWGYLAAALDPQMQPVRVDALLESYEAVARTELYRRDFTPSMFIHGVLNEFDLPDLRVLFEGRELAATIVPATENS